MGQRLGKQPRKKRKRSECLNGRLKKKKIYGPVEEGTWWRVRTNKEVNDILQRTDIVKFIKSLRLGWYGHVKRM